MPLVLPFCLHSNHESPCCGCCVAGSPGLHTVSGHGLCVPSSCLDYILLRHAILFSHSRSLSHHTLKTLPKLATFLVTASGNTLVGSFMNLSSGQPLHPIGTKRSPVLHDSAGCTDTCQKDYEVRCLNSTSTQGPLLHARPLKCETQLQPQGSAASAMVDGSYRLHFI